MYVCACVCMCVHVHTCVACMRYRYVVNKYSSIILCCVNLSGIAGYIVEGDDIADELKSSVMVSPSNTSRLIQHKHKINVYSANCKKINILDITGRHHDSLTLEWV